jgi:AcrR family transcriptional regulator
VKEELKKDNGPKARIIETACRLFYMRGYNNTGINQILDEAKVAKASLYQHYTSKEEVGIEYLKLARAEWFAGLDQWTGKKNTFAQKVLACFDFLEYALTQNEYRGCKFINILAELADGSQDIRKQVVAHKSRLREYIKNYVNEARLEQGLDKNENIADAVYLLFEGAIVESKIYKDAWPTKSARKTVKALIQGS